MNLRTFVFLLVCAFSAQIHGQSYNNVFGIRVGDDMGVSMQQRLYKNYTVQIEHQDAMFSSVRQTSLVVKKHYPILTRRFNVFLGGGLSNRAILIPGESSTTANANGALINFGGEFTVGKLNITYDYSPGFLLGNTAGVPRFHSGSGLGIRYVIWGRESQLKKVIKKMKFWDRD